jgi:hypothetical protein
MNVDDEPSADGILHCLRLLADEAAHLKLSRTFSAIEAALAMITLESGRSGSGAAQIH